MRSPSLCILAASHLLLLALGGGLASIALDRRPLDANAPASAGSERPIAVHTPILDARFAP